MIANRIRNSIILSTTLTASLLAAGCDAGDAPEDFAGDQAHALRPSGGGGIVFNTLTFGHLSASEVVLGQPSPDGVVLESVEVLFDGQYAAVENLWAEQGEIHATIPGYEALHAYDLLESRWSVVVDGELYVYTITEIFGDAGLYRYNFVDIDTYGREEGIPACGHQIGGNGPGNEYTAVVIENLTADPTNGTVSYNSTPGSMFIACETGGVGKAVTWGYAPYDKEVSMNDFQAAVRMVRDDLCGDGGSWTQQGTPIFLLDKPAINWNDSGVIEAVWTPDGAACLGDHTRTGIDYANVTCNGQPLNPCLADGWDYFSLDGSFSMSRLP